MWRERRSIFSEAEEDRDWRLYAGDMIEFAE